MEDSEDEGRWLRLRKMPVRARFRKHPPGAEDVEVDEEDAGEEACNRVSVHGCASPSTVRHIRSRSR